MRRSRFEQLVNLYLDGEITKSELRCLRRELLRCPRHRKLFTEYWRLHKATCKARIGVDELVVRRRVGGQSRSFHSWFTYASVGAAAAVLVLGFASLAQVEQFFASPDLTFAAEESTGAPVVAPPLEVTPSQEITINLLTEREFEQLVLQDIAARGYGEEWNRNSPMESLPLRFTPRIPFGATIEASPAGRLIVQQRTPYHSGFKVISASQAR